MTTGRINQIAKNEHKTLQEQIGRFHVLDVKHQQYWTFEAWKIRKAVPFVLSKTHFQVKRHNKSKWNSILESMKNITFCTRQVRSQSSRTNKFKRKYPKKRISIGELLARRQLSPLERFEQHKVIIRNAIKQNATTLELFAIAASSKTSTNATNDKHLRKKVWWDTKNPIWTKRKPIAQRRKTQICKTNRIIAINAVVLTKRP